MSSTSASSHTMSLRYVSVCSDRTEVWENGLVRALRAFFCRHEEMCPICMADVDHATVSTRNLLHNSFPLYRWYGSLGIQRCWIGFLLLEAYCDP